MLEGAFNDIPFWKFSHIPELLGTGRGFDVKTEVELDRALEAARQHSESFCILDVHLDPHDISPALQRLTQTLAKRVRQGPKQ
jgi:indolepyruvate decarboxylase